MAERIRYSGFPPEAFNSLVGQLVYLPGADPLAVLFCFLHYHSSASAAEEEDDDGDDAVCC